MVVQSNLQVSMTYFLSKQCHSMTGTARETDSLSLVKSSVLSLAWSNALPPLQV